MTLIVAVVLASLVLSFLCSLCEAALYAVPPAKVETLRASGSSGHRLWLLRKRMEDAISGIATINTIAQTAGAAWAGALVSELYGNALLGIFSALFTATILFLSEIIPKSIGVAWARTLAVFLAWPIQIMIWIVWPVAKLCTFVIRRITRRAPGQAPSEDEIIVMADLAAQAGAILSDESRWVKNVLRLNNVTVRQLMTPREVIQSLPAHLSVADVETQAKGWVHSRIPLTEDANLDRVVGIVQRRVVFDALIHGNGGSTLRDLMRPALFVTDTLSGQQMLALFMEHRQHVAIVTDSASKVVGILSLEDLLEYLLGHQIVGEHDTHPEMERLARERTRFHAGPEPVSDRRRSE